MSQELNLEEGKTGQFSRAVSRNFQRGTKSAIEIEGIGSIRELPQSCYHLMADGLLYAKKTLDPRKPIGFWIFLISCVIAISVDPLFFYVPFVDSRVRCLGFDRKLRISAIVLYAFFSFFYMTYVNFLLPTSLTKNKAKPYLLRFSIIDFLVLFPIPLVLLTLIIEIPKMGVDIFLLPMSLFLFQYLLRVIRISVLFTEATKTSGILAEAKWTKAAFNLLLYLQGGHVFGGLWYFFAVEREVAYWKALCGPDTGYVNASVPCYCDDRFLYNEFRNVSCTTSDSTAFDFGIFDDALQSGIVERKFFLAKLFYCLRWGVQTLSCFGQNLKPSTFVPENFFVICITIYAVVVFVFLVGNMQTYLQSETIRSEELRLQGRETEQWMSFWKLSEKLQKEVQNFQPYKGLETKIVHAEDLLNKLPRDLQKNIKCELCLESLRKVGEFGKLSESALEDLCDCLKPASFNKRTRIAREGDPVDEMLIVVRGKLRTYTSRDITTGSPTTDRNSRKNILLKDGDICGKELVTWVHADPYSSSLPISTTTILAVTNVEAFAVMVEDLQNVFVKQQAVHFIQSFWRFRRVLRSRKNIRTST